MAHRADHLCDLTAGRDQNICCTSCFGSTCALESHRRRYPAAQSAAALAIALFSVAAISIDPTRSAYETIRDIDPSASGALYICYEVLLSFVGHVDAVPLAALVCLLALPVRYTLFGCRDSWRLSVLVPAALIAACMVFGKSYDVGDSARMALAGASRLIDAALAWTGWAILAQVGICLMFACFDRLSAPPRPGSPPRSSRWRRLARAVLDRRPLAGPLLTLAVAWSPALIAACPGMFMGDTSAQILQWFNLPNATSDYLDLINPQVLLNAHHPIAHTALLGGCVQLGLAVFGDENAGVLIYTVIQFTLSAAAVAYLLRSLCRFGLVLPVRVAVLAFFALVPLFSNYAVLITKDVLFADALLLLIIQMAKLLFIDAVSSPSSGFSVGDWIALTAGALGSTLLRNGGIVFAALACLIAAGAAWRAAHAWLAGGSLGVLALVVVIHVLLGVVVMPVLDITPASRREVLSVPFQQTACFVAKHDGANAGVAAGTSDGLVSPAERAAIDRVLGYATLASRYDPDKSDAVKNGFNERATSEDLTAYLRTWAAMFAKDPAVCISATANNYYGYFYPSERDVWVYSTVSSDEIMARPSLRPHFDFHRTGGPLAAVCDRMVNLYRVAVQRVPLISLTMSCAPYVWLLVLTSVYVARARRWAALAVLAPIWSVLAVCLIGPCNGSTYMRYLYPAILTLPFGVPLAIARSGACRRARDR